jgi:hypothetical protein
MSLLASALFFVTCLSVFSNFVHPRETDFLAYWAAAKLAANGHPQAAYDPAAIAAVQATVILSHVRMPFGYPPAFLLLIVPLGLIPCAIAFAGWIVATGTAYLAAARRLFPGHGWIAAAAFPPVVVSGIIGQNGLLTAALVMAAATALPRRPFIAGLFMGCLVIKPQLALLYPLAFVAGGQWRAFAGAAVAATGLSLLALLSFGPGTYMAMGHEAALFASIVTSGNTGWYKMASVYSALRLAGLGNQPAWACHILVALAAAAMTAIVWRGRHDLSAKMAVLVAASMLVSPCLYVYDTVVLLIPLLWLLGQGESRRWLVPLWLLPIPSIAQNWGFNRSIDLMPLLPIALLLLIGRRLRPRRSAEDIGGQLQARYRETRHPRAPARMLPQ